MAANRPTATLGRDHHQDKSESMNGCCVFVCFSRLRWFVGGRDGVFHLSQKKERSIIGVAFRFGRSCQLVPLSQILIHLFRWTTLNLANSKSQNKIKRNDNKRKWTKQNTDFGFVVEKKLAAARLSKTWTG